MINSNYEYGAWFKWKLISLFMLWFKKDSNNKKDMNNKNHESANIVTSIKWNIVTASNINSWILGRDFC